VEYDYQDELQQVEAIKKWWRDNGASVLTGLVLGLTLLFGWRYWQDYNEANAQKASSMYEQVMAMLEKKQGEQARQIATTLVSQYSQSTYAAMTELLIARQDLEENNLSSSHAHLQWVIDWKGQAELVNVARVRKARLYLSENKLDDAKNVLASVTDVDKKSFQAAFTELQGDIAVLEGKFDDARTAYSKTLESKELSNEHRTWIQTKLDNLGIAADQRVSAAPPKVSEAPPLPPTTSMSPQAPGMNLQQQTFEITPPSTVAPASMSMESMVNEPVVPPTPPVSSHESMTSNPPQMNQQEVQASENDSPPSYPMTSEVPPANYQNMGYPNAPAAMGNDSPPSYPMTSEVPPPNYQNAGYPNAPAATGNYPPPNYQMDYQGTPQPPVSPPQH